MKSSIFWLKNRLFRWKAYKAYKESLLFDKLQGEEKKRIEFEKCRMLVDYAYNHVPFYRSYYDECGFRPEMLSSWADWEKVPPLEKQIIRTRAEELLSDKYKIDDLSITTTGGSTGTPLRVYKDNTIPVEVMGWRAFAWWGIDPSANVGILHRRTPTTFFAKMKNRLLWWPTRRSYLNASKITEQNIVDFIDDIKRQKTVWLQGYCSALENVADYIIKKQIIIDTLKMVWCTSSPLLPLVRKKLEKAFNCSIMDQYGCCEMWNIAIQKPEEPKMTVCNDFVHVDIVDANNMSCDKDELGDILITDLNSFAYPLIKYRLGDKSSYIEFAEDSEDGYPKIDFVRGRITDSVHLGDGTKIDGAYLTTICDNYYDLISSYQIYQKKDYSVELRIVLKDGVDMNDSRIYDITNSLRSQLGKTIPFSSEIVDSIPDDRGKKRYIISEIALSKQ
ncbi:MAG: phenylacetate--CoA ligase family protein [Bacteroidales bacterium]|nr:phenylacetate--CoA ligase family protein [Bacteroidales bacterium]